MHEKNACVFINEYNLQIKLQIKPTRGIYVLHILHGQFPVFDFLISFLKA